MCRRPGYQRTIHRTRRSHLVLTTTGSRCINQNHPVFALLSPNSKFDVVYDLDENGVDRAGNPDMLTLVLVGSTSSFSRDGRMVTPRGYAGRGAEEGVESG